MQISSQERLLGILGYLSILFIIPLKVKRDSMFVQFHSRQGGVLFSLWAILSLIVLIVLLFIGSSDIGTTVTVGIWLAATILYAALSLIGIFKVALGERYRMPVVADLALALGL